MTSILSTGTGALLAYQRAMNTVSGNVANIGTAGYTRQSTQMSTLYTGGVQVQDVVRIADELVNARLLDSTGELARLDKISTLSSQVDTMMSDKTTNLNSVWSNFFDSVSALTSTPSSSSARQAVLDNAKALATRFNQVDAQLDQMDADINASLGTGADQVNSLTTQIAKLNGQIANNKNVTSDLLDKRDQLVSQVVTLTGGSIKTLDDNSINLYLPGGQALVVGTLTTKLTTVQDAYQASRLQLGIVSSGQTVVLDNSLIGGSLGGSLEFRSTMLDPTLAEVGRLALATADTVNQAQNSGVDLYGNLGSDLFTIAPPEVLPNSGNSTPSATLQASVSNIGAIDGSNVTLRYGVGGWTAKRADTGAALAVTGTGTAGDPLVVNGVQIVVSGTPANGDSYLLHSSQGAAGTLAVAFNDTSKIAAAKPVQANTGTGNIGNAAVDSLVVNDVANPALQTAVTVQVDGAGNYSTDGGTTWSPYASTNPATISINGWTLTLKGAPSNGDTFTVSATGANSSDNSNLLSMAALDDKNVLNGGTVSINNAIAGLTTRVGSSAQQAEYAYTAQKAIQTTAQSTRDSVSGVNADEEAANLLFYQQAYQAAAQVISTANTTFQTLLSAVQR
jgi:flagellar hook-associated protein 1 FlgK